MKQKITNAIILLMGVLCVCGQNAQPQNPDIIAEVINLKKMSYTEASRTVDQILDQTRLIVLTLLDEIRGGSPDVKLCAIYLLGEIRPRDINSIEVLLKNIDFKAHRVDPRFGIGRWGLYPSQEALGKIGLPTVGPILEKWLPNEDNESRQRLMCAVLVDVEGVEFGQLRLRKAIGAQKDAKKKERLESALKALNGIN
ncbi:MAG: hypothetical protein ACR2H1_06805 [Limisphaerales bacterium]